MRELEVIVLKPTFRETFLWLKLLPFFLLSFSFLHPLSLLPLYDGGPTSKSLLLACDIDLSLAAKITHCGVLCFFDIIRFRLPSSWIKLQLLHSKVEALLIQLAGPGKLLPCFANIFWKKTKEDYQICVEVKNIVEITRIQKNPRRLKKRWNANFYETIYAKVCKFLQKWQQQQMV